MRVTSRCKLGALLVGLVGSMPSAGAQLKGKYVLSHGVLNHKELRKDLLSMKPREVIQHHFPSMEVTRAEQNTNALDWHHIAFATADIAGNINAKENQGVFNWKQDTVASQGVKAALGVISESSLLVELVEPFANPSVSKSVEGSPDGVVPHHGAVVVEDVRAELHRMNEAKIRMIDIDPRLGAFGKLIGFVHPKVFNGLVELVGKPKH